MLKLGGRGGERTWDPARFGPRWRGARAELFTPLPGLNEGINQNACPSEKEEGLCLDNLKVGDLLELETKNRTYVIENRGNGQILISGHPKYCPQPTPVELYGSTWGRIILKPGFIGRHMNWHFATRNMGLFAPREFRRFVDQAKYRNQDGSSLHRRFETSNAISASSR